MYFVKHFSSIIAYICSNHVIIVNHCESYTMIIHKYFSENISFIPAACKFIIIIQVDNFRFFLVMYGALSQGKYINITLSQQLSYLSLK